MDILKTVETIEEYWLEKMPTAIWKALCWIVCIWPFIAIGWAAHKIWTGLKTGWFISREFSDS